MGFVGRLEDLGISDIFQILALGKRTGKLTLTRRNEQGLVVFRNGAIVFCQTNAVHETLGSILVNRHLIDEATLLSALDRQPAELDRPLGSILVEMGVVDEQTLHAVAYEQVKAVLSVLLTWDNGVFQFETVDIDETFRAAFDASEFLVEEGLRPEEVILDLLTQQAHSASALAAAGKDLETVDEIELDAGDDGPPTGGRRSRTRGFASLKGIMTELRNRPVTFTGELTLMLLRYTAELVNRSVLLAIRGDNLVGIGQFGIEVDGAPADQRVRTMKIPIAEPSVLGEVVMRREPYRGRLAHTPWNNYLIQHLGGMVPREVVAVPIVVEGSVVAVIYGDNLPDETPIGPTEGLELLMIEAGLIIEKHRLEARLREARRLHL
jgi:Domain of unknown function (DUF4388)